MNKKEQAYHKLVKQRLQQQAEPDLEAAVAGAKGFIRDMGELDESAMNRVRDVLETELRERIRQVQDPYVLSKARAKWYDENIHVGDHWPALVDYLRTSKGWSGDILDPLSKSSRDVVAELGDPAEKEFDVRGVVVGHVQSGKTANMTAVIARAIDAGYNLVVVLAGTTDKLRHQTQARLEGDLLERLNYNWYKLTKCNEYDDEGFLTESGDYRGQVSKQLPSVAKDIAMIAVMKKHSSLLKRLIDDIKNSPSPLRQRLRMLVIDDEADQASPNASKHDEDPTPTNRRIRELLRALNTTSYIGYTATPFANVLINPFQENVKDDESSLENLYPRDFIIALPRSDAYFGAEQIFGRDPIDAEDEGGDGLDVIRQISASELGKLHPKNGQMSLEGVPTLRRAIRWFLLVVTARLVRGQDDQHTSMLIHTSHKITDHSDLQPLVENEVAFIQKNYEDCAFRAQLKELWEEESEKVDGAEFGNSNVSFADIECKLGTAVSRLSVAVENSESDERLSYGLSPSAVIAIGGNILARGLTLEGLAVTYFTRNSRQYDTLLQMGRWFGYRIGYEDLIRLWLPKNVSDAFRQLASVEYELREEIQEYSERKARPIDFAVRIRTLPGLQVTARNKMRHAKTANIDYRGLHLQTIRFPRLEGSVLSQNWSAASSLVSKSGITEDCFVGRVGVQKIVEFFQNYAVHSSHRDLNSEWLEEYINKNSDVLAEWSVCIIQPSVEDRPISGVPLGPINPRLMRRSRLKNTDDNLADIKALMSRSDVMADIPSEQMPEGAEWRKWDWSRLKNTREQIVGSKPMLLIYPIDRASKPLPPKKAGKESSRVPLDAAHDVLGVGLVFPQLGVEANKKPTKYIQVDLSSGDFESWDDDEGEEESVNA